MDTNDSDASQTKELLIDLASFPDNNVCADCGDKDPQWTSANLGLFICIICAGIHRNLGTHISRVKSIMLDTWKPEEVEVMRLNGNKKGNELWEEALGNTPPVRSTDSVALREQWIKAKYVRKLYQKANNASPSMSPRPLELPSREGWMVKKGDVVKNWKKRSFKLMGSLLLYYKKDAPLPSGYLSIVDTLRKPDCLPESKQDHPFCFIINTPNRDYYLCAETGEEMYDWIQTLRLSRQYLSKPSSFGNSAKAQDLLSNPSNIEKAVNELTRIATFRKKGGKQNNNCIFASVVVDCLIHAFRLESRQEGVEFAKVLAEKGHIKPCQASTTFEPFADKADVMYSIS